MKTTLRVLALVSLAALAGCALPSASSNPSQPVTGAWENWQIQAGSAITSPPSGLYFIGAVQAGGTQSSSVFTTAGMAGTSSATLSDFLGTYNSSTGAVFLLPATTNDAAYAIGYTSPSTNAVVPVNVTGGCIGPYGGGAVCNAIFSVPSVGVEIAPLTGTYTGPLTDASSPNLDGTATLILTQASTPSSDGSFAITGSLTLPAANGIYATPSPITGSVSGEALTLTYCTALTGGGCGSLYASVNPEATQLNISNLTLLVSADPLAVFTGTLTRQ